MDNDENTLPVITAYIDESNCKSAMNNFNNIHFLNDKELEIKFKYKYPTFLLSAPGSGNTFIRLILEYITNIWTGSIYGDKELLNILGFEGEMHYDQNDVIIVKVHPEDLHHDKLSSTKDNYLTPCFGFNYNNTNNIKNEYITAIFIIRDPWKAAFSAFQFYKGHQLNHTHHTHRITIDDWKQNQLKTFGEFLWKYASKWSETFRIIGRMKSYGWTHNYIVVKYEDLINFQNKNIIIDELKRICKFLYNDEYWNKHENKLMERIECIVNDLIPNDYERFKYIHRSKLNKELYVNIDKAYNDLIEMEHIVICGMWDRLKIDAKKFGYKPHASVRSCSSRKI